MQLTKILIVVGFCIIIAGCTPITGFKGILTLLLPGIAALGATIGWIYGRCEDRVHQKAKTLDTLVSNHKAQYHNQEN